MDPNSAEADGTVELSRVEAASDSGLSTGIEGLRAEIRGFQGLIDRLYSDNEELRRGQLDRMIEPLLRDLFKLSDDWRRRGSYLAGETTDAPVKDVSTMCHEMVEDVEIILERHGVEKITPELGSLFDRREQRAIGTAAVADPALDSTVEGVRRPGYRFGGRMLRFPEVLVHRFAPDAVTPAPAAPQ
jgi:molecular chaperone GrpE (heat shock protein)